MAFKYTYPISNIPNDNPAGAQSRRRLPWFLRSLNIIVLRCHQGVILSIRRRRVLSSATHLAKVTDMVLVLAIGEVAGSWSVWPIRFLGVGYSGSVPPNGLLMRVLATSRSGSSIIFFWKEGKGFRAHQHKVQLHRAGSTARCGEGFAPLSSIGLFGAGGGFTLSFELQRSRTRGVGCASQRWLRKRRKTTVGSRRDRTLVIFISTRNQSANLSLVPQERYNLGILSDQDHDGGRWLQQLLLLLCGAKTIRRRGEEPRRKPNPSP
ncbi:hypothetical protein U1Q18_021602 [Sarracenia purpurea var. burkii]